MIKKSPNFFIISCSILMVGLNTFSGYTQRAKNNSNTQNPSPMVESIRSHERVSAELCEGKRINWQRQDKLVQLFVPNNYDNTLPTNLVIHFHGLPNVTEFSVCTKSSEVILTITGGSGSSSYEKLFSDGKNFMELLNRTNEELGIQNSATVTLSGWSAGYGAIRAIVSRYEDMVDNIILLDGLHASYIPEKQVLYDGGVIDSLQLQPFLNFAKRAVNGKKQMVITHSSIFPGTYASTTESTEYLIQKLGLKRNASLKPGPVGMQQVGETKAGKLLILSFAGNTAPDHIDHLHGLCYFVDKIYPTQND